MLSGGQNYVWGWEHMHWLMAGLLMLVALAIVLLTRRVHLVSVVPPAILIVAIAEFCLASENVLE